MSTYVIKAFGVTKEILGARETVVEADGGTVRELRRALVERYPTLRDVRSLMIAVNNAYAEDDLSIDESDEIALIPPVSGG
ncbi:MAG TPA: MoaD/ThiS family protein [Chryseosolibacter sp.]|jgi:molybdopterin synthase sulfur carrier subunit|nr:MoaD/ThiS family protein [Chryseosolibacter sp.]